MTKFTATSEGPSRKITTHRAVEADTIADAAQIVASRIARRRHGAAGLVHNLNDLEGLCWVANIGYLDHLGGAVGIRFILRLRAEG